MTQERQTLLNYAYIFAVGKSIIAAICDIVFLVIDGICWIYCTGILCKM